MHSDPISDFLTQIRNASAVDKEYVSIPHSNLKEKLTDLLVNEGYLAGYKIEGKNQTKSINIELKYTDEGSSVIAGMKRVSKPGNRV